MARKCRCLMCGRKDADSNHVSILYRKANCKLFTTIATKAMKKQTHKTVRQYQKKVIRESMNEYWKGL